MWPVTNLYNLYKKNRIMSRLDKWRGCIKDFSIFSYLTKTDTYLLLKYPEIAHKLIKVFSLDDVNTLLTGFAKVEGLLEANPNLTKNIFEKMASETCQEFKYSRAISALRFLKEIEVKVDLKNNPGLVGHFIQALSPNDYVEALEIFKEDDVCLNSYFFADQIYRCENDEELITLANFLAVEGDALRRDPDLVFNPCSKYSSCERNKFGNFRAKISPEGVPRLAKPLAKLGVISIGAAEEMFKKCDPSLYPELLEEVIEDKFTVTYRTSALNWQIVIGCDKSRLGDLIKPFSKVTGLLKSMLYDEIHTRWSDDWDEYDDNTGLLTRIIEFNKGSSKTLIENIPDDILEDRKNGILLDIVKYHKGDFEELLENIPLDYLKDKESGVIEAIFKNVPNKEKNAVLKTVPQEVKRTDWFDGFKKADSERRRHESEVHKSKKNPPKPAYGGRNNGHLARKHSFQPGD